MNAFTSDTKIMFNEVLDSVALLHVIRQEVEAEKQRMELEDDDSSFSTEELDSGDDGVSEKDSS